MVDENYNTKSQGRMERASSSPDDARLTFSQILDNLDDVVSGCHSDMEELQKRLNPLLDAPRDDNSAVSPGSESVSEVGGRVDRMVRSLEHLRYQLQTTTRRVDL